MAAVVALGASAFLGRTPLGVGLAPEAHVLGPAKPLAGRLVLHALGGTPFRFTARLALVLPVAVPLGLPSTLGAIELLAPPATDDGTEKPPAHRAPPGLQRPCSRRAVVDGKCSSAPGRDVDGSGALVA